MFKHKGFPSRMPGTDFQFTVRHEKKMAPAIISRKRKPDAPVIYGRVDSFFLRCLIDYFGESTFVRGNLDSGRLGWLLGREIIPADDEFSPVDYGAKLKINFDVVKLNYPELV
tara:strand:+ start:28 stop:366 length:339 start_codon:yes stop_codon:yes gene_type:complete